MATSLAIQLYKAHRRLSSSGMSLSNPHKDTFTHLYLHFIFHSLFYTLQLHFPSTSKYLPVQSTKIQQYPQKYRKRMTKDCRPGKRKTYLTIGELDEDRGNTIHLDFYRDRTNESFWLDSIGQDLFSIQEYVTSQFNYSLHHSRYVYDKWCNNFMWIRLSKYS